MNKCENCNKYKNDVKYRTNPYEKEIHNNYTKYLLCDNCHKESINDI